MKVNLAKLNSISHFRHFPCALFLFFLFFVCCKSEKETKEWNTDFDIEQSIRNTVQQFAYYENLPSANSYNPVRTIILEEQGVGLYLHEAESPEYGRVPHFMHYIITIVNSQDEGYSIPMFSNEISGYWNFEIQDKYPAMPDCHTSFEKEVLTAIDSLHLNDTIYTDCMVLLGIMGPLINCRELDYPDTLFLSAERDYWYEDLKCRVMLQKSFDVILQDSALTRSIIEWEVFWDRNSERIYHVHFDSYELPSYKKKKADISIKVYNTACESE